MPTAAPATLTVHVLLFASYADTLGRDALELTLSAPATVTEVVEYLRGLPGGGRLPAKPLCARNLQHAAPEDALADGDEIAILPPLAGG